MNRAVEAAIAAAELAPGVAVSSLAGGCMHVVELIALADGDRIVCKRAGGDEGARMLHSEAVSLRAIAHIGTPSKGVMYDGRASDIVIVAQSWR